MQPQQQYVPPENMGPMGGPMGAGMPSQNAPDKKQKMLVIGGIVLAIAFLIFMASLVFSGDKSREVVAISVALHQEQLRINQLVETYGNREDFDLAEVQSTVDTLVLSDMVQLQAVLGEEKLDKDIVEAVTDIEVETRFEEARSSNSFNQEYVKTMSGLIDKNLQQLRKLEPVASATTKEKVITAINNQEALLKQLDDL